MFIHFLDPAGRSSAAGSRVLSALTSAGAGRIRPASPARLRRSVRPWRRSAPRDRGPTARQRHAKAQIPGQHRAIAPYGGHQLVQQDLQNPARWGQHLHAVNFAGGNRSKDGESTDRASGSMTAPSLLLFRLGRGQDRSRRGQGCFGVVASARSLPGSFPAGFHCGKPWGRAGLISRAWHGSTPCPATISKKGKKEEGKRRKGRESTRTDKGGRMFQRGEAALQAACGGCKSRRLQSVGRQRKAQKEWSRETSAQMQCNHFRKCRPVKIRCCL